MKTIGNLKLMKEVLIMTTVTLNINGIELIEKVNTEIKNTYDT